MNSFLGIEMTNHQVFTLLAVLATICSVSLIIGFVMMNYYKHKFRYDRTIIGCHLVVYGGLGLIVCTMLAKCFE